MASASDDNEWTVVNRSTNKNKRKVAKRRPTEKKKKNNALLVSSQDANNNNDDDDDDYKKAKEEEEEATSEVVCSRLSQCRESLQSSQFYNNLIHAWNDNYVKKDNNSEEEEDEDDDDDDDVMAIIINEIVCYGIGNFATKSSVNSGPLWQLALALELKKIMIHGTTTTTTTINVVYYDPLITSLERQLLQKRYQIEVLSTNERGIRRSTTTSNNNDSNNNSSSTTLFFMPHCPKGLYENVLWANWDRIKMDKRSICIIGNSLVTYVERAIPTTTTTNHSTTGADDATASSSSSRSSCLELIQPFVQERLIAYTKKDIRDMPGHFEAAFNDTYLTTFFDGTGGNKRGDHHHHHHWPERPKEPSQDGQNEVL